MRRLGWTGARHEARNPDSPAGFLKSWRATAPPGDVSYIAHNVWSPTCESIPSPPIGGATAKDAQRTFDDHWNDLKGIDKGGGGKLWHPTSFDPGTDRTKATQTAFSFNVDGRVRAQTVIEQMEYLTEHATGAPAYL
jgi:hypothetical protein